MLSESLLYVEEEYFSWMLSNKVKVIDIQKGKKLRGII